MSSQRLAEVELQQNKTEKIKVPLVDFCYEIKVPTRNPSFVLCPTDCEIIYRLIVKATLASDVDAFRVSFARNLM